MKNNFVSTVKAAIAETQDGKSLKADDFSQFILNRIEHNTKGPVYAPDVQHIQVAELISDFEYMISQLKKALIPLQQFEERYSYLPH